jgi:hypothetical protein
MKLQKITRMHGMLMILGAVLLLANITRAQQEVDPTTFDTTSGDASTKQSAGAKTARHSEATDEMKAKAAAPVAAQERQPRGTRRESYTIERPRHRSTAGFDNWDRHERVIRTTA